MAATGGQLVFVGAGHAHLYALKRLGRYIRHGVSVTVINPEPHLYYSAVSVGLAADAVRPEQARIDIRRLVVGNGGRFVQGRVLRIDTDSREAILADQSVPWDAVSLDIGSTVRCPAAFAADPRTITAKPLINLQTARQRLADRIGSTDGTVAVVIAGGGPTGCEVAGALDGFLRRSGLRPRVDLALVCGSGSLLADLPAAAGRLAEKNLAARGIRILGGRRVTAPAGDRIQLSDGTDLPCDLLLWAGGPGPRPLPAASALPVDETGAVRVDDRLRCIHALDVFAAGDCARLDGRPPLAKAGVHAIRQAPILHHNLLARLTGGRLKAYRPPKRILLILNLGDGRGLAARGRRVWCGRAALRCKQWLDARFLRAYGTR